MLVRDAFIWLNARRVASTRERNVRIGHIVSNLVRPPLDNLQILLSLILERRLGDLLLDGRRGGGRLLVVRGKLGVGGEAGGVGAEVLV